MIERTTSTGKVLRLLEPGDAPPEKADTYKDEILDTLSGVLGDAEEEKIVAIVVLGIPARGFGMEFYSTGMSLGDLMILREEFDEVISSIRHPNTR